MSIISIKLLTRFSTIYYRISKPESRNLLKKNSYTICPVIYRVSKKTVTFMLLNISKTVQ